jgi:hypothetical protein
MSFSYNLGSNPQIDAPRMLIADTDSTHPIFQDEEILLAYQIDGYKYVPPVSSGVVNQGIGTPSYRRAASVLLDCLASNKARLGGALKVLDIDVDLSKAAQALREAAAEMRDVENRQGVFGIAEQYLNEFAGRERLWNQFLRITS